MAPINPRGPINNIPFDPAEIRRAIEREVTEILREDAAAILKALIPATPVGRPETWKRPPPPNYVPGHARRNWQVNFPRPSNRELPGVDAIGAATLSNGLAKLKAYRKLSRLYIENNVPYIERLNEGWSPQAPPGFVEIAIQVANVRSRAVVTNSKVLP